MTDTKTLLKQHYRAAELVIAASRLRDADDRVVAYGREIRDGYAGRGTPADVEGERAIELCDDVTAAYETMRRAERAWEAVRDA